MDNDLWFFFSVEMAYGFRMAKSLSVFDKLNTIQIVDN